MKDCINTAIVEAISGLLQNRDFLGLQLNHAWGNITDDQFSAAAEPFLAIKETADRNAVEIKTRALLEATGIRLDGETIADVFNCNLDDAIEIAAALLAEKT